MENSAYIKNLGGDIGVALLIQGRGCQNFIDRSDDSLVFRFLGSDSTPIANWPITDNGFIKVKNVSMDRANGVVGKLPATVVNCIQSSGSSQFIVELYDKDHVQKKVECSKQGSICVEEAYGESFSYTDSNTQSFDETLAVSKNNVTETPIDHKPQPQSQVIPPIPPVNTTINAKKSKSPLLFIIIGAIVALLIIVALCLFIFSGNDELTREGPQEAQSEEQVAPEKQGSEPASAQPQVQSTEVASVTQNVSANLCGSDYSQESVAKCAQSGSAEQINAFVQSAVSTNQCNSAYTVLSYRARNEKSDYTFAYTLAKYLDPNKNESLPCVQKNAGQASYYYDKALKLNSGNTEVQQALEALKAD